VDEPTPRYRQDQLDAAIDALAAEGRIAQALRDVQEKAPELEHILEQALREGGFFGTVQGDEVRKAVESSDPEGAIRALLAEETRLGMMLGVAIGMELLRELGDPDKET
jgi:hypothetical protein